eukprot:10735955-Alexandrium_andersonii.AAC.1
MGWARIATNMQRQQLPVCVTFNNTIATMALQRTDRQLNSACVARTRITSKGSWRMRTPIAWLPGQQAMPNVWAGA